MEYVILLLMIIVGLYATLCHMVARWAVNTRGVDYNHVMGLSLVASPIVGWVYAMGCVNVVEKQRHDDLIELLKNK